MQEEQLHKKIWAILKLLTISVDVRALVALAQYKIDMAHNRTQLQSLTQKTDESFKEYAQRWRGLVARVQPPLLKRELVDMFMSTLQGPYLDRMVRSASSGFSDLVITAE